ncbi:MAG: hypothetical protein QM658_05325 [Gordonia sp. (in: high G+C Gram-positive bacteria)]
MHSRAYAYAILLVSATTAAVIALPWVRVRLDDPQLLTPGPTFSWNGFGGYSGHDFTVPVSPPGYGWWIAGAALVAALAAAGSLTGSPSTRRAVVVSLRLAALCALAAAAVPIAVLIWPGWYLDDFLRAFFLLPPGVPVHNARDVLAVPIIVAAAVLLVVVAGLCAAASRTPKPQFDDPTGNEDGPAADSSDKGIADENFPADNDSTEASPDDKKTVS